MQDVGNPHAYRRDIDIRNKYHKLKDQQERIQQKTFTKWINHTLRQNGSNRQVQNILEEIKDGVVLLEILEILTKEKVTKEKSSSTRRPLQINNVSRALDYLRSKGVRLVNINCSDVVDGKPPIVLGLIWKIILHLQIRGTLENESLSSRYNIFNYLTNRNPVLDAKDFGPSWRSGVLFNKLINAVKPGLVDENIIVPENAKQNLQNAFRVAEEELDIPPLLDAEDIDVDKPDEVSIITYVGEFLKKYPKGVDDKLKKTLLSRAERLGSSGGHDEVDRNSNITSLQSHSDKFNIVPYTLAIIFVILYKCIWIIIFILLLYKTVYG